LARFIVDDPPPSLHDHYSRFLATTEQSAPIRRAFDEKLHVIHFDAHTDYAPFENDLTITNSHAFRHIGVWRMR
jgi:hypothetical protein